MYYKPLLFKLFFLPSLIILLIGCNDSNLNKTKPFTSLEINHVLLDSTINIRAIEIKNNKIYNASSTGAIYSFDINSPKLIKQEQYSSTEDSIEYPNFRSLAITKDHVFAISIANPALIFKDGKVVYRENHEKVFYDSMHFWNDKEGIVVGDFTDNCINILITRDGGNIWNKVDCNKLNSIKDNEGFFAASDTNITIIGDKTWLASGGINSRIYYSKNKGLDWIVIETPIIQGETTTGIFSIDFYDKNNGFAIGGDYTKPLINSKNKIRTSDGGLTWNVVAENENPGYRSCVQYVPNSKGLGLVSLGFDGIDYSSDAGDSWTNLSSEGYYSFRFYNDSIAYAAGNGKISKLHFK
ncbi:MAG: oxidoreductase [Bacteroidetes bacterium]|jgi:hypothetical protein|nr:MAG: hypothetical protein ABR90_06980 [Cryomorphaceae bacterium BACL29 MAG-121220-bin8]MDA1019081.1 oxidoreductase [Bacteroidota bacterium]|tara:strand:+ start:36032 stop:37093 length:1062 start_codon:yes stop_codon:yes gene_type:complete